MKTVATKDTLIDAMNALAEKMIRETETAGLTNKIDVFSAVTKWIGVKNRLNIADEADGSLINAYRDKLADTPAPGAIHRTFKSKHPAKNEFRNAAIRDRATRRSNEVQGNRQAGGDRAIGGPQLDALKRRLPDTNARGALDDLNDAGGASAVAAGRRGRIQSGAVGPAEPDDDGTGGEPGL